MKKPLLCLVLSVLVVVSLLFAAAGCTQEKKLSAMSEKDQLEFLAEQGIEIPAGYADYIISFIARVEKDPGNQARVLAISNPVLIDLCCRVEEVVCEYYGYEYSPYNPMINDYRDPEKMTMDLLYAVFNGDGEDVWEACNFDAFLDLGLKYGTVEASEKDDMIDKLNDLCEDYQEKIAAEPDVEWGYELFGESYRLSKSEVKAVRDEIDPDGKGLEIENITVCNYAVTRGDEDYDFGAIVFLKVDGEYMVGSIQQI